MDYQMWKEFYPSLEIALTRLHDFGIEEAKRQKTDYGDLKYLWADAIADALYVLRAGKNH
jgi:hypothetical protein